MIASEQMIRNEAIFAQPVGRRGCAGSWTEGTACGECRPCLATKPGGHKKGTESIDGGMRRAMLLQLAGAALGQVALASKAAGCLRSLGRYIRGDRPVPDQVLGLAAEAVEEKARELVELAAALRGEVGK